MKYIMFPYFVGCMYEGGATEYIKVKTKDPDAFIINLLDELEKFVKVLNDKSTQQVNCELKIEGISVPYEAFLSYDEENKIWIVNEPNMEEYLDDDIFVVELHKFGYSHYYFLKSESKEELMLAFEKAYQDFISKENPPDKINISDETFHRHDLVYDDVRYDQKGRKIGDIQYPNFEDIYTREEWFAA